MSRKKVFLLLISLVFMMSLFANAVSAQEDEGGLASAFETIKDLFGFLPEIITLEKLIGGDAASLFWAKFLIWVLLFAITYFGASFVFKDNKNIAIVVAIVISLMTTLLIPKDILINIFQTYSLVASIVVWCIPLVAGVWIAHKIENKFTKAIIYWLAVWMLININATLVSKTEFGQSFQYFGLLLAVVIIMAIWNTIGAFGGAGTQEGARGWLGDRGRSFWDTVTKGRDDREGPGATPQTRQADSIERREDIVELIEERNVLAELRKLLRKISGKGESNKSAADKVKIFLPDIKSKMRILWKLEIKEITDESHTEKQFKKLGIWGKTGEIRKLIAGERRLLTTLNNGGLALGREASSSNPSRDKLVEDLKRMIKVTKVLIGINSKEIKDLS